MATPLATIDISSIVSVGDEKGCVGLKSANTSYWPHRRINNSGSTKAIKQKQAANVTTTYQKFNKTQT